MENITMLLTDPTAWAALLTLIAMEVVLGIDNLLFISIITNKLPEQQRAKARRVGITLALVFRLVLLATVAWIVQLVEPVFSAFGHDFSWKDIILIAGGFFLVWKATKEIHHIVDPAPQDSMMSAPVTATFAAVITQILILDLVFSVDSIITAVGMTPHIPIMVVAVVFTVIVMLLAADPLAKFIESNPTIIMLALSFLLMIGMTLIAEGLGFHVPKGYVYTAMAFSAAVEFLNMLGRRKRNKDGQASAAQ